jgi:hemolysin III
MKTDITSAIINLVGWLFFLVAGPILLFQALEAHSNLILWVILYMTVQVIFWPIQIGYHLLVNQGKDPDMFRRIDRGSMLFLIAAIFAPVLIKFSNNPLGTIIAILLWLLAILGMGLLIGIKELQRKLAPILGFIMGIIGMIVVFISFSNMHPIDIFFFIMGTLGLIGGGVVYSLKKPDPKPEFFGFHEVFHTLMTIGAIFLHILVTNAIFF